MILEIIKSIIFGIVQGITEWLPISSTAHLIIFSKMYSVLLNKEIFSINFTEMFDVVIQLGAVIAVVVIFFKELNPFRIGFKENIKIWYKIIVATIPLVIFTLIFKNFTDNIIDDLKMISFTLIFYGIIFIIVEKMQNKKVKISNVKDISYKKAFLIGVFQILAIIPGTSRSGITIICGLLIGLDRKTSAKFSFFLSIPVMLGASSFKIIEYVSNDIFSSNQFVLLLMGLVTTFIVSLFVVRFLIEYTSRHSLKYFALYRIALGIVIIICILLNVF